MTGAERHRRMDAARVRAELTVQQLWLHYLSLGGTGDAFDVDGYLQGLLPLEAFQQDVLAQALNEALEDCYRTYRVPLSESPRGDAAGDGLHRFIDDILDGGLPAFRGQSEPPAGDPA